ncbi:MAG: hypothetical protein IT455_05110 [Planctomycetes bacterium]|nr:hypothetical protein [Planctomycetota bacterium]
MRTPPLVSGLVLFVACQGTRPAAVDAYTADRDFLAAHVDTLELAGPDGARVLLVPAYQGRVMTSTTGGGDSSGWLNRELIASRRFVEHMNGFGGEDRFWIGPEGGQFSVFFAPGTQFGLADWFTPAPIDTEPFVVQEHDASHAVFTRSFSLQNRAGTRFDVAVHREVVLGDAGEALTRLGAPAAAGVRGVAFETRNTLTNTGTEPWTKASGLLSIWILGMFNAAEDAMVLVPFERGSEAERGPIVNDEYFGRIAADRLHIDAARGLVLLRGDARSRGKIGLGPRRARSVLGSWDGAREVLTIVEFSRPAGATDYVNSLWRLQDDPFGGDVVNSYNDGPATPGGKGFGDFYELESSSPALALGPGAAATHVHRTLHLTGPRPALARIALAVLGADLDALPVP